MLEREPRFDELGYVGHAERLYAGQGYVDEAGQPSDFWPVGFPLVLAATYGLFGSHPTTAVGLQIIIGTLTCVLVSTIGERVLGRSIGRVAALVMALYPTHVFYGTLLLTEPLFTLLLLASCALLLWSLRSGVAGAIAAGAVLGAAILTRPVLLLLPGLVPLWYAANGIRLRRALLLGGLVSCAALAVVSPWLARNHHLSGTWTDVSSTGGYNFLIGNDRAAFGGYAHAADLKERLRAGAGYDWSRGYRLGWEAVRAAPVAAARRALQKISYFFALETDGVLWNLKGLRAPVPLAATATLLVLANVAYVLVVSGCLLGMLSPSPHRAATTLFLVVSSYVLLMTVVFVGDPRYHFPLVPFAALMFGKALLYDGPELRDGLRRGEPAARRRLTQWTILNAAFVLLLLGNLWLKHLEAQTL